MKGCLGNALRAAFFMLFTVGAASACVSERKVIDELISDENKIIPCSPLVAVYVAGLGGRTVTTLGQRFGEDDTNKYYYATRLYLRSLTSSRPPDDRERYGYLIAILSLLDEIDDADRRVAYQFFAVAEYLTHIQRDGGGSKFWLKKALQTNGLGRFDGVQEAICFVRTDMPTLSVDEILGSVNYAVCLEERAG